MKDLVFKGHAPFLVRESELLNSYTINMLFLKNKRAKCEIIRDATDKDNIIFRLGHSAGASPVDAMLDAFRKMDIGNVLCGILELYIWLWLRPQIATICIALQSLQLPALVTLTVVDVSFERSSLFTMALK